MTHIYSFRADLQSPCRLLGVPKELRTSIWTLIFIDPANRYDPPQFYSTKWLDAYAAVRDWERDAERDDALYLAANKKTRDLSLLRVNKFIFREAGRLFFGKSEFRFQDWNACSRLWRAKNNKRSDRIFPQKPTGYARFVIFKSLLAIFKMTCCAFDGTCLGVPSDSTECVR